MMRSIRPIKSRRRFLQGLAAAASLPWPTRPAAAATSPGLLRGTEFALEIKTLPVNITGHDRTATVVNGQLPGPILRWHEGDTVTIRVTNRLKWPTSIHWHGIRTPADMDGVPGLSFPGIAPGETFTYRFPVRQSGTYWYHSHSGMQEQTGHYGPLIVDPRDGYAQGFDRDYVVLLSDWTDERPETIVSNLKFESDYYARQRTAADFVADVRREGLRATLADRFEWGAMRMSPTDILDVTGRTYTYLVNGYPPAANWTALFRPGDRVRLRFINGSAMSIFDVRIPGLTMTVVQADGNDVQPVEVDEFRIGTAETYDVIVSPTDHAAYTILAQAQDRGGYARGTLATQAGLSAPVPSPGPPPLRTMADMGMGHAGPGADPHAGMAHANPGADPHTGMAHTNPGADPDAGMAHASPEATALAGMAHAPQAPSSGSSNASVGVSVDNVAMMPTERIGEAGAGLGANGRRALRYTDLRALRPGSDPRPPGREITLHLTGNMHRFIWGFDGRHYSEAEPIHLRLNERVRFVLINDTMMEHPIHLHGLWSELENGHAALRPYKHTVLVKPAERISWLVTADVPGRWAFHCHLLYHMETGMFREVHVT